MEISSPCYKQTDSKSIYPETSIPLKITRTDSFQQVTWCEVKTPSHEVNCRYHHSSLLNQNKLYVYGGFETNSGILSDFKVYKNFLNTAEWSELPTENGPGPRHSHSSFFYNNNIYIHGGKVNVLDNTSTIFAFNIESSQWRQIKPQNQEDGPSSIDSHVSIIHNAQMIVVGGFSNNHHTNNIYALNLQTLRWRTIYKTGQNDSQPTPRSDFSLVKSEDKLYIYAGKSQDQIFSDFWEFNLLKCEFTEIKTNTGLSEKRSGHSAVLWEDKMIVFGGITGVTHERNDLVVYDFKAKKWEVVWQNSQKQKDKKDIYETSKLKSSKKNSINSKIRDNEKSKTYSRCNPIYTSNASVKTQKYRRTLKEEMMERQVKNHKVEGDRFKKINEKKMMLLNQFEPSSTARTAQNCCSPLLETLTNSILITANQSPSPKLSSHGSENYNFNYKTLKPRDGHTANILEEDGRMVIFGGDRHTIGFNDIILVNLKQLF